MKAIGINLLLCVDGKSVTMDLKLLYSVLVIYSVNVGIIVTVIPLYSSSLGADEVAVGLVVSAYAVAYVAASPLWGKASDLLGRKWALGIGMLGCSFVVPFFSFATDPGQLMAIRLFHGLADASFWIIPTIIITDLSLPRERGTALGRVGTFQGVGFIIGPFLGGLLIEQFGYVRVFYICSALAFSTALLVSLGLRERPHNMRDESSSKIDDVQMQIDLKSRAGRRRSFAIGYLHTVLSAIFFGVIVSQFVLHANEILGQAYLVGLLLTSYYVVETFIQAPAGRLSDIIGRPGLILLAFVVCALGFLMLIFASSFVFFLIAIVVIGGGIGGLYVALTALLMDVASRSERGLVAGMQNLAWGIGYFLGPAIGGVAAVYSSDAVYMLCVIASVIGGTLTLLQRLSHA